MLFVSKYREQRIVLVPTDSMYDENRRKHLVRGITVEFHDHKYITEDVDIIRRLLKCSDYGRVFSAACNDTELLEWKKAHGVTGLDEPEKLLKATPFNMPGNLVRDGQEIKEVVATVEKPSLTEEKVGSMITTAIEKAMGDILTAIGKVPVAPTAEDVINAKSVTTTDTGLKVIDTSKPRKVFHCPICHEEFRTGMDVGKHKKAVHPV